MKKISFLAFLILVCTGSILAQKKKVAVVTFYVDKYIDYSELGSAASLGAGIASLAEDPKFDLTSVLSNFHDVFFNEYAQAFPFDLLPEEEVIGNAEYKAYEARTGETEDEDRNILFQNYLVYEGYKPMREWIGKNYRNELKMLEIFEGKVDGVMFVYLDYGFVRKTMGLTAGIQSYVRMKLWNKEGKRVFAINEFAVSKESVPMVAGIPIMKSEKLLPMCESSSRELIADLAKKLDKVAKKSARKL